MSEQNEDGAVTEPEINSLEDIMNELNGVKPEEAPVEPESDSEEPKQEDDESVAPVEEEPSEAKPETENLYEANLTYSVKGEQKEFDERLASIIKTQEDEEFIRELVTTSEGLASYKEKLAAEEELRKTLEAEMSESTEALSKVQGFYQDMMENRDSKNWRGVTNAIGYTEDDILKFAIEIAKEREQPAHIQQQASQARQLAEHNRMLLANKQMLEQQQAQYVQHSQHNQTVMANDELAARQTEEMNGLISGEYKDLAAAMEARGLNLFNEAVDAGTLMYKNGSEVPATADAVKAAASKYAWLLEVQEPAPMQVPAQKPAIPQVSGGSASPVGEQITSLADLMKLNEKLNTISY